MTSAKIAAYNAVHTSPIRITTSPEVRNARPQIRGLITDALERDDKVVEVAVVEMGGSRSRRPWGAGVGSAAAASGRAVSMVLGSTVVGSAVGA